MPQAKGDLEWISVKDFSPGIQQRLNYTGGTVSPHFENGAATAANTYRCIALPSGGLGPFMGQTATVSTTPPQSAQSTAQGSFPIVGALAQQVTGATQAGNTFIGLSSLLIAFNWTNGTDNRFQLRRIRLYDSPAFDTIENVTQAGIGNLFVSACSIEATRMSTVSATTPGVPVAVYSWGKPFDAGFWKVFPNPSTPSSNTPLAISSTTWGSIATVHQNRSVIGFTNSYDNGSTGNILNNENIFYTNANLTTIQNATADTFGQEVTNSIDFLISTNASELFMGKTYGGCLLLRGDIANVTVYRLPGVTSPGGNCVVPAAAPIGIAYVSTNGGAYVWGGGGSSEPISLQLEDNFWDNTFIQLFREGSPGRILSFKHYIFFPHQWVYDYTLKSWWRLDNVADFPSSLVYYNYISNNGIIATPRGFTSTSTPIAYIYRVTQAATSYRWQSQPIAETVNTICDVREMVLVAQGEGTITVTLTGIDGITSVPVTLTFDSNDRPTAQRFDIASTTGAFQATHVQIQFDAEGDGETFLGIETAAPVIHEFRMGINDRMHMRNV